MRIVVTGSADGLGQAAADALLSAGHNVVMYARNQARAAVLNSLVDRGANHAFQNQLLQALAEETGATL